MHEVTLRSIAEAKAKGWKPPATVGLLMTWDCWGGCGRSITVDREDTVRGYVCMECRRSMAAFHSSRARKTSKC